jgi:hypothetical protein
MEGKIRIENSYQLAVERASLRGTQITIDAGGSFKMTNGSISDACTPITNAGKADFINVTFGNNYCASLSYSISNNRYAGAIHNSGGTVSLTHVTMARNFNFNFNTLGSFSVYGAGAIYNEKGLVQIKNSIVSNNRSNWFYDCRGIIQSLGNNIIGNSEGCTVDAAEGDLIGTLEGPVDPKLAGINSYESSPRSLSLLINSPAIDAADPFACPTHDQLGNPRPVGGGCDIGALEGAITGKPAPYAITFTSNYHNNYPGYMMCMTGRNECTYGLEDADYAHIHAEGTVQFFIDRLGRNSLDDAGTPIVSTVQYAYFYDNAFWTNAGFQIVYGPGFSKADDVVAHEIAHGFTSLTSNLFYYYQSGAINESLSDLWGEYYDQVNKRGNDSAEVKWAIGEDLFPVVSGPVRNMKNPPAYKDPDKITSVYYYSGPYDNGGVHYNSGVNNKAVYLMVDGGSFNNRTVRALGWKKTSAIYYYAQTRLLTSASDYKDLYYALDQACNALIGGTAAITADDCKQARAATDAVEMNLSPSANFNPDAPTCPNGTTKSSDIYFEDFENGLVDWSIAANAGSPRWSMIPGKYDFIYATSGKYALFGNDLDEIKNEQDQASDSYAVMKTGITIPTGTSTMLHFNHAYGFEWENKNNVNIHYDGGVLEYTTNDGVSWIDAKPLFSAGRNYAGSITDLYYAGHNPLKGREAFVRDSRGYVSSRYNLASLGGQTVRFRWRMGTDLQASNFGWVIDDVRIYRCSGTPGAPVLTSPSNNSLITNYQPKLDWNDAANAHHYELAVANDANFDNLYLSEPNLSLSEYTIPSDLPANTKYYWRVRTVNDLDSASAWSTTWSFRTALTPPAIEAPAIGSFRTACAPPFAGPLHRVQPLTAWLFPLSPTSLHRWWISPARIISYSPTVNLPANVPIYWRVRANGTNTSAWTSASFTSPNPPGSPGLSSPASNAIVYTYTPLLKWNASSIPAGAPALASYHLQFDDDADFSSPLYDQAGLTERTFTVPDPISANQKFYWRVKAVNVAGQYSAWSSRALRTAIVPPELTAPASDFVTESLRPVFEWSSSPGATNYTLVVSTLADFTTPLINITQPATSYTPSVDLPAGAKLYWRVRAEGANPSAWASSSFMIPVPPTKPGLSSPASAAKIYTYTPTLKWNASVIPTGAPALAYYQLQVDNDADYSSLLYDQTELTATSFTIPEALTANQKFYWRVRAVNILGQYSSWSARTFSTTIIPPVIQSPVTEFVTNGLRPMFEWSSSPGATSYTLVLSTLPDFTTPLINITQATNSYTPTMDLPTGAMLYWRVRANGTNASAWTASSFMIPVPPAKPALSSPASNALVRHDAIILKWKASVIAAGAPALAYYQVQFDDTADYSSPLYQADLTERTFTIPDALPANQKFYWRVRAVNILGQTVPGPAARCVRASSLP